MPEDVMRTADVYDWVVIGLLLFVVLVAWARTVDRLLVAIAARLRGWMEAGR